LQWENSHIYANMTTRDREDQVFCDTLIKQGVPKEQITFLKDKEATLENIKKEFSTLLKKTKKGDFLITYFCGHGTVDKEGKGYFINYDAPDVEDWSGLWEVSQVFEQIENEFNGDRILMTADCCNSGSMSEVLKTLKTDKAYACLSSSLSTLVFGDLSTFTETLVSAFAGQPYVDTNGDGRIALSELRAHTFEEVGVFMQQEIMFSTNQKFPSKFNLVKALERTHEDVGKYYEIKVGKRRRALWRKAKACEFKDGMITFSYYPGEFREYKTIKADSKSIRSISRKTYALDDVVDVLDGRRWHPAKILKIDEKTGLHTIRYEKRKGWDGLYFYNDLRLRSAVTAQTENAGRRGRRK